MSNLKDIKRLKRIKATCVTCGNVRHFGRTEVAPIWNRIDTSEELPATWDMACPDCDGTRTVHFLDWPDKQEHA